jgi:single-strand DNA-binding protein
LQTRKWENKEGVTQYTTEIVAREMKMLSPRGSSSGDSSQAQGQYNDQSYPEQAMGDDVPF